MEPKEDKPSVAQLRSLLNRTTRIKITDGRLFVGQFMCIDHSKNIILSAAYEYRTTAKTNNSNNTSDCTDTESNTTSSSTCAKRFVGLVMIPGHHIVKAEMDCSHLRGADSRIKAPTKTYGLDYLRG
ncbi:MAG: LSM domain-containing protein [Linnemannia elongata]|nr:MAG: LSM domain-containing protein [Linnemannia elongata]